MSAFEFERYPIVLQKTARSEIPLSLKSLKDHSEGTLSQQQSRYGEGDRTSPMPQDTKEIIQFKHSDHEQVAEKQQAAHKKRATNGSRNVRRVSRSTKLKLRSSLTLKRRKPQRSRTKFKRRRIHLKHSDIEQPQRSKEVAEMQQEWRDSFKVQVAGDTSST